MFFFVCDVALGISLMTKKEEIEAGRAASAASIRPGWICMPLSDWKPKKLKPPNRAPARRSFASDKFAAKDQPLTREQLDRRDYKPFWTTKTVLLNDPNFATIIFKDPYGHYSEDYFSAQYTGHVTDSGSLETQR